MTTLADALELREWSDVVVLGGPPEPPPGELTGVTVLVGVRSAIPDSATGGVVCVPHEVHRDDWVLDVLVRRAASVGVDAVLVGGTAPLGRASALVALRLGVLVLGAPDPMAASVALRVNLALPELAAARWTAIVGEVCSQSTGSSDALVDAASVALARPIGLLDSAGHIVAGTLLRSIEAEDPAVIDRWWRQSRDTDTEWVTREVATDHPRGAYLVLRRRPADPQRAVTTALGVLGTAVSGRLAIRRLAAERDARQRMSLMSELLQSAGQLSGDSPRRWLDQGWQLHGHHVGIRIDVPSAMDPVALREEILAAFVEVGLDAQVVEQGAGWSAWTTFREAPSPAQLQAHSASIRRVQWSLRSHLPTVMGVGRVQSGPDGLARSLGEAGDAARIAATRAAGGHLVHVDRLGLSQLLLAWTRTDTFAPAASSLLMPLRAHPELLQTLAGYLESESSIADTAAVLGVHRNTVSTRIARAVELLNLDLDDPDERLAVQLACRSVLSQR